jgi:ribosomal protein S18 acetylase RimI-like enzyme
VYKIATEMTNHGLLASNADSHDGRKRSLSLTKKGHDTVSSMIPIWEEIRFVTKELVGSSSHNILTAIGAIEEELDKKSVYNRIRECMESRMMDQIEIVDYMSRYKHHFSKLNRQWLQRYFSIEEHDELILERPYYEIIKKGGCILFARLNRRIVGTAALLKHGDGVFELTKMAVAENVRRRFVGTKLTAAIIERCIVRGADSLYLETNSQLKPAQQLYRKMGFKNVDKSPISQRFKRGRIMMKLDLNQQKPS